MKEKYVSIENEPWPCPGWEKWDDLISRAQLGQSLTDDELKFLFEIMKSYEKIIKFSTGPRNKLIKKIRRVINVEKRAKERELQQKIVSQDDWLQSQIKKMYG